MKIQKKKWQKESTAPGKHTSQHNRASMAKLHILAHEAWQRVAYYMELPISDRKAEDRWYRDQLKSVTGLTSGKDLDTELFEKAMFHFATLAENDTEIAHWVDAAERRHIYQVHAHMRILGDIRGEVVDWDYVRTIMDRMKLPELLADMTAPQMQDLIAALDTHFRRMCKDIGITGPTAIKRQLQSKSSRGLAMDVIKKCRDAAATRHRCKSPV